MRKLYFIIIFVSYVMRLSAQNTSVDSLNSLEEKVYGLSLVWSEIKYNFVNIDRLDFDLDSLYKETLKRVINTKDDISYYKEISYFLNKLNDAHTDLFDYPESGYEEVDYPNYGTERIGDRYYFVSYKKDCEFSDSTLLGAEIIEVNGLSVKQYIEKHVLPYITGSTIKYKLKQAGRFLLNGKANTYINVIARCLNGDIRKIDIIRNGETIRKDSDIWLPEQEYKFPEKDVTLNWADSIAILRIRRFFPESISNDIDNAMNLINKNKCKGVIIDLRNNSGGHTNVAWRLQMYLTEGDSIISYGTQTRINNGYGRAQGNYRKEYEDFYLYKAYKNEPPEIIEKPKEIKELKGPVVILINNNTFSACEDLLINIYENHNRPILVGEETAGSTGAPLVVQLPHEAIVRICTIRPLFPQSHKPFIEKGIVPDVEVIPTLHDYLSGKDIALKKAIDLITNYKPKNVNYEKKQCH